MPLSNNRLMTTMKNIKPGITIAVFAALALTFTAAAFAKDPKGSPAFVTDYEAAIKKAKKEDKPLIVIFSAAWCGPCQANKKNVYPSAAVKPYHDKFVWAYLDTDDKKNHPAIRKYKVRGIPHIEFVGDGGDSLGQAIGGTTPKDFARTLASVLKKAE